MKRQLWLGMFIVWMVGSVFAQPEARTTIDLNGVWDFEQTETAFPPKEFTRKIPVPGLIHLAEPKIEQFDKLLTKDYQPRYNWYRLRFSVPSDLQGTQAVVTLLKSMYGTQVYLNGMDLGGSMACYTPIEFPATSAVRFGAENELLVRVGERPWLPSAAAGSTDKEKIAYVPGIWDSVSISFTRNFRIHRLLALPDLKEKKVTVKLQLRSFQPAQIQYGDPMSDKAKLHLSIREKKSGNAVAQGIVKETVLKRDNITELVMEAPMENAHLWSPDDPFLYTVRVQVEENGRLSDALEKHFGMREFHRQGKHFTLNGKKIFLRGTNITLHRFFEDPECADLPWNKEWTTKLLADIPKEQHWNAMRICVGIAPDFWYDIADESGLLLQNEWLYWQNHGWDDQIRAEYTDWVWADGNHPSIAIWDAINENWDEFIGNVLIPDLKKLDPTRMWDAGYMTSEHMALDEMDEPHPYRVASWSKDTLENITKNPYNLGDLHDWPETWRKGVDSSAAQLANEYGWVWLWRDGSAAKLTKDKFDYYVGANATPDERREMEAYWLQCETEWLRAERQLAGVLAFCYLTNNLGFTGDWFVGPVAELNAGPTLRWFPHCFAPTAVFIDLVDQRYTKHTKPYEPGTWQTLNLVGVNDLDRPVQGDVTLRILDAQGEEVNRRETTISIPAYGKEYAPIAIQLPQESGGYLLLAEYRQDEDLPVLSRRYIKVGAKDNYLFYDYAPKGLWSTK